jgi:hypothetical protein
MKRRLRPVAGRLLAAALLGFIAMGAARLGWATELRGLVESRNLYTGVLYPRQGATVTLFAWNGYQWVPIRQVVTAPNGMYYFSQVLPGPYVININGIGYNLQVMPVPFQDIPPVFTP